LTVSVASLIGEVEPDRRKAQLLMPFNQSRLPISANTFASLIALAAFLACSPAKEIEVPADADSISASTSAPRLFDDLGDQTHPISTESAQAQRYFNQGMILSFGFNHDTAIRSFEEASRLDPECGMCRWGIALALGPNINAPMGPEAAARAYREVQHALELTSAEKSPRERAYVEALATRYSEVVAEDRSALDRVYADAMREVHLADPDDHDAATLFAESLMDLYPWAYWTSDGEPREFTTEIIETIEAVLDAQPDHVGANHYYIHAVEEFFPEKGEAAADRLGGLSPGAGHLVHMPSHIYWRIGRYEDATEINQRAAESDERFFSWCRSGAFYRALYYPHNIHFLWAAAAAEGRRDLALMSARKLAAKTSQDLDEFPFMQEFAATPMLTMARFGLWDSILGEPRPDTEHVYLFGVWQYTQGLAKVRTGSPSDAKQALSELVAISQSEAAMSLALAGGMATATTLLEIAISHLESEIAIAEDRPGDAIASLELASQRHDALPYTEPPPWYAPPRQLLGAVLLEEGRAAEAESVYLEDLRQYPKNGWSLLGLSQSLRAQGEGAKADWAKQGFEAAWGRADFELDSSRI
jgi:tetratricopeptide (TPR) repeat protein